MGDRFRKAQAENFKKGRDRALREASEPRLIDRPDVVKAIYQIQLDAGKECRTGERLKVICQNPDGPVLVSRDHQRIGIIEGEGGKALKKALVEPLCSGIAELCVLSTSEISGDAAAEFLAPSGN